MELKLIKWLAENAIPQIRKKDKIIDYYWCLREDAENSWDYLKDDRLQWYSSEQIFEIYKQRYTQN
jgi:hypothetical protein